MNETDIGMLIEDMFKDIKDRESNLTGSGRLPDGSYMVLVKIDNKRFTIVVRDDEAPFSTLTALYDRK